MTQTRFNPAPGWPVPPRGWLPGPGWRPDPSWPTAPPEWPFLVDEPGESSGKVLVAALAAGIGFLLLVLVGVAGAVVALLLSLPQGSTAAEDRAESVGRAAVTLAAESGERPLDATADPSDEEWVTALDLVVGGTEDVTVVDVLSAESAVVVVTDEAGEQGVVLTFEGGVVSGEAVTDEELSYYY